MIAANLVAVAGLCGAFCMASAALAQQPDIYADPQNLKVLSPDISSDDLRQTMRSFSLELGVRCTHCHVGEEGQPLGSFEFDRDDKEPKQVAREMIRMVREINARVAEIRAGADHSPVPVRCVTCHRGQDRPRLMRDVIAEAVAEGGADAAVTTYRELREQFYGRHTFDFGLFTLSEIADRLIEQDQAEAGMALHELGLEYFPDAAMAHVAMGGAHQRLGNRQAAISSYRRALELAPDFTFLQRRIDALEAESDE